MTADGTALSSVPNYPLIPNFSLIGAPGDNLGLRDDAGDAGGAGDLLVAGIGKNGFSP